MANFEKLPKMCYAVNGVTGKVISIKLGEHGYHETTIRTFSPEESKAVVSALNSKLGVSKAQAVAMYVGSLFNWDVPGADPDNYNDDGTAKKLPEPSKEDVVARYKERVEQLRQVDDLDTLYTSADFQCDQMGGFPSVLVWNLAECEVWLEPREDMASSQEELDSVTAKAADWGFHLCCDAEDFNELLEDLGEDAVDNATIAEDDEW